MAPYLSPLANPEAYISKIRSLSTEGITIDKGIARGQRAAAECARKYASDFQLVSDLQTSTEKFGSHWTDTLQQSRDAASSLSGWLQRFIQVFLALVDDIQSDGDCKDVITELEDFVKEGSPSKKYNLDGAPGVKIVFNEIEVATTKEAEHVIEALQKYRDWKKAVEVLRREHVAVKAGCANLRNALNNYATKLD